MGNKTQIMAYGVSTGQSSMMSRDLERSR